MAASPSSVSLLPVKDEPSDAPLDSPPTPIKMLLLRVKPEPMDNSPPTFPHPSEAAIAVPKHASVSSLSTGGGFETAQQEASAASEHPEAIYAASQDEPQTLQTSVKANAAPSLAHETPEKSAPFSEARAQLLRVTEKMRALENNGAGGSSEQTGDEIRELRQLAAQSVSILSQLLQMEPKALDRESEVLLTEDGGKEAQQEGTAERESRPTNLDQQSEQAPLLQECAALLSQNSPPVKEENSSKGSVPEELFMEGQETTTAGGPPGNERTTSDRAPANEKTTAGGPPGNLMFPPPDSANMQTRQSFGDSRVENLPNPGLFDGQAGPQTPPKVCVKAEWSEERAITPPLDNSLEVQSRVNAEHFEQEEDVGSGLEDNDDGFESEPEMEEPQEEEPAFEVPPVAQLFSGESDEEAAESEQSESEEERPKKTRKTTKKKAKAGKKLPVGIGKVGTPAKAGAKREGGPLNRKPSEPIDVKTKRFLQSLERQFKRSFTRAMLPSHVGGGYWLGIFKRVADQYMEQGKYEVEFMAEGRSDIVRWLYRSPANKDLQAAGAPEKTESIGFSGGWIHCAIAHNLVVGDIVLFEKLNRQKFRLHIFRKKDFRGDAAKAAVAADKLAEQLDGAGTGARKAGAGKSGKGSTEAGKKQGVGAQKPKKGAVKEGAKSALQKEKRKAPAEEIERLKDLLDHKQEEMEAAGHHLAQTRLTDIYPVVKEAKGLLSKELTSNSPAGSLGGTAGTADATGGISEVSGKSSGEKRVKCTPKRRVPTESGKKRSLSELVDSPLPKKARVETAVEESGELQSEDGRPVHQVDGGHRYEEASESDQQKARQAMEDCETEYPSFKVVASKSHVNKGFWLSMSSFCRENNVLSDGLASLVDAQGGVWHTRIKKEGSLSGGWRGFSIDHKLEVGDGLVFEMVLASVFRVRIFRASEAGQEDACSGAGKVYKDVGIGGSEKEKHKLSAQQKKTLAQILNLPGGLRKPAHSSKSSPPVALFPASQLSPSEPAKVKPSKPEEGHGQAKLSQGAATSNSKRVPKKRKKTSKGLTAKKHTKGVS